MRPRDGREVSALIAFNGRDIQRIVVLTGAGVSAESGLATFRDSDGLWENHDPMEIFKGLISGVELVMDGADAPQLIVLAEDKLQLARLARRTKLYEQSTLEDLVNEIASAHGLQVVAADLSFDLPQELQANETDLGFLRRICARFDVDFQIVGDEMHISPRALARRLGHGGRWEAALAEYIAHTNQTP